MNEYHPIFKTCAVCGKSVMIPSHEYIYKRRKGHGDKQVTLYFCGWNHMRDWEKAQEKKIKRGKNKHADYG